MASSSVRVGLVLPETSYGNEEYKNATRAVEYADEAAKRDVQLLLYPEGYPGPMTGPLDNPRFPFDPIEALKEKARQHHMYIVAGNVIESDIPDAYSLTLRLLGTDGDELAQYHRSQPDVPPLNAYIYSGKEHFLPGREPCVVETELGRIGLSICSEIFVPELQRLLMLRGAEIVVSPVHGFNRVNHFGDLRDTWGCVARTRAAENLCYVLVTQNLYVREEFHYSQVLASGAIAAGPEAMEGQMSDPGILVCDIDMGRLRALRSRIYDEVIAELPDDPEWRQRPLRCIPGKIYERDPALYSELAAPSEYSFDYEYYSGGDSNAWRLEYDRIYRHMGRPVAIPE